MFHRAVFIFLIHLMICTNFAMAGSVQVSDVSIEVRKLNNHKYSFVFCEMSICKPFGNAGGYDLQALENMNNSCKRSRRVKPIVSAIMSGLSFSALTMTTAGTGALIFVAGQYASGEINNSIDQNAIKIANDVLPSLTRNDGIYEFLFDDFVALKSGLQYCHSLYESTPGIWLEDCDRDLQCKRNLAKSLQWSEKRIANSSAYEMFSLKQEQEAAQRIYDTKFGEISQ